MQMRGFVGLMGGEVPRTFSEGRSELLEAGRIIPMERR